MILVTGGTGRLGSRVVTRLLAGGAEVRALVRPTSVIPGDWEGVEVVSGDMDVLATAAPAVQGADTLFLLSPMTPWLDLYESALVGAAERAGVRHVVKLSTTTPHPNSPIPWWRAHWRAEQRLRASSVPWTVVRPNGIAMFLLDYADDVSRSGGFATAAGDGRMALVHPDDVADVCAALLLDGAVHRGATLDLTGPEAVCYDDVAAMLGGLLSRPVTHTHLDADAGAESLRMRGFDGWLAEGILANWLMTRDGAGGFGRLSGDVEAVLGRPPRSVSQYLAENLPAFAGTA